MLVGSKGGLWGLGGSVILEVAIGDLGGGGRGGAIIIIRGGGVLSAICVDEGTCHGTGLFIGGFLPGITRVWDR